MTKPRYLQGCVAGSQDRGEASSSPVAGNPDYAWNVNFNNGNSNWNNRNNNGFVRAVRGPVPAGEYQDEGPQPPTLRSLYDAMVAARRGKKPSGNMLHFMAGWIDGLIHLQARLQAGTWSPRPSTCFIARQPKAREIHAPDFADRVVHHWLVPQLEALYAGHFIHQSYSNQVGKGTHAAVDQLRHYVRQVESGQGGGWYLQLDIANFFNSIHRPTLWRLLKRKMQRAGLPMAAQLATHALLRNAPVDARTRYRATAEERAQVPPHKRLQNAAPGCGLPIGNLSSQFFANVYLDPLDQFIKHQLKATRYVRYVDDFVLVHHSRDQLESWRLQIRDFLSDQLRLSLKAEQKLQPLGAGIDFLGYVLYPTHTRVRRRVISHARQALAQWERQHVAGDRLRASPEALQAVQATIASYEGHFRHASTEGLQRALLKRFPWISAARVRRRFDHRQLNKTMEFRA